MYRFDCPVVLLTATLPVRLERPFRELMLAEDAALLRARTTKRNIRYRVETVPPRPGAVDEEVVRTVRAFQRGWGAAQKGVVYCRSKSRCEALAEAIGCAYYHSGVAEAVRQARFEAWAAGTGAGGGAGRWIVATTGLGTGVDVGGLAAVVHAELPYGLVDFSQQTGRGARGAGETADSVVVWDGRPAWASPHSSDIEQRNRQAMDWFVQSVDCRRVVLGTFLDGQGADCATLAAEACDRCQAAVRDPGPAHDATAAPPEAAVRAPNRLQAACRARHAEDARLAAWLRAVRHGGSCPVCLVKWLQRGRPAPLRARTQHPFRRCRTVPPARYAGWRRQLVFPPYSGCFRCGLPAGWCAAADPEKAGAGVGAATCEWTDTMLPVVLLAEDSRTVRGLLAAAYDVDAADAAAFRAWLGRGRHEDGVYTTNAFTAWRAIITDAYNTADALEKREEKAG